MTIFHQRFLVLWVCFILAVLPVGGLHAQQMSAASPASGLVPNSGFESVTGGQLDAWRLKGVTPPALITAAGVSAPNGFLVHWSQEPGGGNFLKMEGQTQADKKGAFVASPPLKLLPGFGYEVSFRYRAHGLQAESLDRKNYVAINLDLGFSGQGKSLGNIRVRSTTDTDSWVRLSKKFTVPPGTETTSISLALIATYPNAQFSADWDDISVTPQEQSLTNTGFEAPDASGQPQGWMPYGAAKMAWVHDVMHGGQSAVSVSDAPDGPLSGWSAQLPIRADRSYIFSGYVRGGTTLSPNGFVGGGALSLQFLDAQGQAVGKPVVSDAVPARTDWKQVSTPAAVPPAGAVLVRLTAGLQYCTGTAWFDDVLLSSDIVVAHSQVRMTRTLLHPSAVAHYAKNLLANGDVEAGDGDKPAQWTYHGNSSPDWSQADLQRFHSDDLPPFEIGRGQGVWSRDTTYAGKGALLNISVDPPLAQGNQHHSARPVDGYWLSSPMPCAAGHAYLASAWMRFGVNIARLWYGPLELQFFDGGGNLLQTKIPTRSGLGEASAGNWTYWATLPWVAPSGAVSMRLRFGQELHAALGGLGRTYADNLSVWELPSDVPLPDYQALTLNTMSYEKWFREAIKTVKPPYLPAPDQSAEYDSAWGMMDNSVPGNLSQSLDTPFHAGIRFLSLLGEDRKISLVVTRYDVSGHADAPITVAPIDVPAFADVKFPVDLPPSGKYGAFYLDVEAHEGDAVVGHAVGRYAVLPPLDRPRTAANIWGMTPLVPIHGDGRPFEGELAHLLKVGGFGIAWVRMRYAANPDSVSAAIRQTQQVVSWYQTLGIRCVVQLFPTVERPVNSAMYRAAGQAIGQAFSGKVAAIGNWGIEMANSGSPYRGGGASRYTDDDYDSIVAAQYDGIKSSAPSLLVLTGNIATDLDAKTLHRLSTGIAGGKFDGAIINAYLGPTTVLQNALREMDANGGTNKTVWLEETADQRAPFEGDARRQGEGQGPLNMVRSWLTLAAKFAPRLRAITMWGFVASDSEEIMMVTPDLQPRPHFAAFAVMTDTLADAQIVADHSNNALTAIEWKRSDGPLFAAWANSGAQSLTLLAPGGKVTVMDLYGNRTEVQASGGRVTLKLGTAPEYIWGGAIQLAGN